MIADPLLISIAIALSIPVLVLFVQVVFAWLPNIREVEIPQTKNKIAILIPAHNEAEGIIATIQSIHPQLKTGDRLLIVADNCTDNTAAVAREHGAEVIERTHATHRGKGYALDFGVQFLAQNPPDIVVIIDADCIVQEGALLKLANHTAHYKVPVQSLYLMLSPQGASLKSRIAEFAWVVKNQVRARGYKKLGLPCPLMGSGMAFPWETISQENLANGNIVEDLKLGIDLCKAGSPPLFYETAVVTSHFPSTTSGQTVQRTRWEHGHLSMILSQAPRLFMQGIFQGNKNLLAMAFDLCVPPLALLVVMLSGLFIISSIAALAGMTTIPFLISLTSLALLACAILLAWWGWGRGIITITTLLLVPVYVLSKIPYYFNFIFKRQKKWVRTDRE